MIRPPRVVVVGGGISGLVTAYRLTRTQNGHLPPDVIVMEASPRAGGKLMTITVGGMPVEAGADSFVVRKPWAVELCRELGLAEELVRPAAEGAYVWTKRRLVPFPEASAFGIPSSAGGMLRWPGLSRSTRIRAVLSDLFHRAAKDDGDESLGSVIRRRLGPEALRVLVGPLLAGIHAGDPDRLSLLATFPELRTWERGHESLIRGSRAAMKAARRARALSGEGDTPIFASLAGGLSDLVASLEAGVGPERVWLGTPAAAVHTGPGGGFAVHTAGDAEPLEAAAVVIAAPAFEAARLLELSNPAAAGELAAIPHASTAAVYLVYAEGRLPEGTGFLVPLGERSITACTWVSSKWPRGDVGGRIVLRCFVGRAGDEGALDLKDEDLVEAAAADVREALDLPGLPTESRVVRWPRSMPQYEVGHLERIAAVERALERTPGLFVTGSALRGVGIADCVHQANQTAERVSAHLHGLPDRPGGLQDDDLSIGRR